MDNTITGISTNQAAFPATSPKPRIIPQSLQVPDRQDSIEIGGHAAVSSDQAMGIVLERSMAKLQSVVSEARKALGFQDDAVIDTSPEATANRIADFALGAFSSWQKNHTDLTQEDARAQFSDFIGGAIQQGIDEARGILSALQALTPEVDTNINTTWDVIQGRLNDFVKNGL